jgi:hypothetical protein
MHSWLPLRVIRCRFHLFPASHNVRSILKADIRFQSIICREGPEADIESLTTRARIDPDQCVSMPQLAPYFSLPGRLIPSPESLKGRQFGDLLFDAPHQPAM